MFTGLVEQVGKISRIERLGADSRLIVDSSFPELVLGESIAVDGACLTVDAIVDNGFTASASTETLARTTLGQLQPGQPVHLERALALGGRLGGHIVTGHVDGLGKVKARRPRGKALEVEYELPEELVRYVAAKGSIAIDGVSLTVNELSVQAFSVMLVPFTRSETHLDRKQPGEPVNLETDVLAKYVARLLQRGDEKSRASDMESGVTMELLVKQGFLR